MITLVNGEPRHLRGWVRDSPKARAHAPRLPESPPSALPVRASCVDRMPPVVDQGAIGSCASFAFLTICRAIDGVRRSELYAYYYARQLARTPPNDDDGCALADVSIVAGARGLPPEQAWPYSTPELNYILQPPSTADVLADESRLALTFRCAGPGDHPSIWAIKASIAAGFPVAFGTMLPASFSGDITARSGIMSLPKPGEVCRDAHAMVIYAYDDATSYFTVRNSWGVNFGVKGDVFMPYSYVERGLVGDAWSTRRFG